MCKTSWDEAWERADDQGIYTMDQCCDIADARSSDDSDEDD